MFHFKFGSTLADYKYNLRRISQKGLLTCTAVEKEVYSKYSSLPQIHGLKHAQVDTTMSDITKPPLVISDDESVDPQSSSPLFNILPAEIRLMIFEYTVGTQPLHIRRSDWRWRDEMPDRCTCDYDVPPEENRCSYNHVPPDCYHFYHACYDDSGRWHPGCERKCLKKWSTDEGRYQTGFGLLLTCRRVWV